MFRGFVHCHESDQITLERLGGGGRTNDHPVVFVEEPWIFQEVQAGGQSVLSPSFGFSFLALWIWEGAHRMRVCSDHSLLTIGAAEADMAVRRRRRDRFISGGEGLVL